MKKIKNRSLGSLRSTCIVASLICAFAIGCTEKSEESRTETSSAMKPVSKSEIGQADLVNRELKQLPHFESDPLFCKIAVGLDPVAEFWTVADLEAKKIYFDLNQNFDLTESNEVFDLVDAGKVLKTQNWAATIPELKNGEDVHTDLTFKFGVSASDVKTVVSMNLWGWDESTTDADLIPLRLPKKEAKAPTIHFNGPLTMGAYREPTKLTIGKDVDFYSLVGTAGKNGGTMTAITNTEITDDAHPKAVFTFPNRDSSKPPLKVTTYLEVRC
jgi:hypothetical protein